MIRRTLAYSSLAATVRDFIEQDDSSILLVPSFLPVPDIFALVSLRQLSAQKRRRHYVKAFGLPCDMC